LLVSRVNQLEPVLASRVNQLEPVPASLLVSDQPNWRRTRWHKLQSL